MLETLRKCILNAICGVSAHSGHAGDVPKGSPPSQSPKMVLEGPLEALFRLFWEAHLFREICGSSWRPNTNHASQRGLPQLQPKNGFGGPAGGTFSFVFGNPSVWSRVVTPQKYILNASCGVSTHSVHAEDNSEMHFEVYLRCVRTFWPC